MLVLLAIPNPRTINSSNWLASHQRYFAFVGKTLSFVTVVLTHVRAMVTIFVFCFRILVLQKITITEAEYRLKYDQGIRGKPLRTPIKKENNYKGANPVKANQSRKTSKKITGQGMSEYMVIVGLLAVAGIAVMGLMGNVVRENVGGFAVELSGGDGSNNQTAATTQSDKVNNLDTTNRSLSDFSGNTTIVEQ